MMVGAVEGRDVGERIGLALGSTEANGQRTRLAEG